MDNEFFSFVETYKDEIIEFFKAFKAWIEAIVNKISAGEGDSAE